MFAELPKLFDRNFALGFFLPSAIFTALSVAAFGSFHVFDNLLRPFWKDPLSTQSVTYLGVASWLGGIALLALNYELYRFFEGYGRWNPLRLFFGRARRRFRRQLKTLELLKAVDEAGGHVPTQTVRRYSILFHAFVRNFPDEESHLLPTSFGNTIRAFEIYPNTLYGADAIPLWPRLVAVIPKDYRELIDDAKALTDLWLNLRVLSWLFLLEYVLLVTIRGPRQLWIPILAAGAALVAASRAKDAAVGWGDMVKSAFDVFLPDLRKKLEFPAPKNLQQEQELWDKFSRAVLFHRPQRMPDRARPADKKSEKEDNLPPE